MHAEPSPEHLWLKRFLGDWTFERESPGGPGAPPVKSTGTESFAALGDLWVVGERTGAAPGGGCMTMRLTLGFDPRAGRFVGSWVFSVLPHLFVADGSLDAGRTVLTLDTAAPAPGDPTKTVTHRHAFAFESDAVRVQTSSMLNGEGVWTPFMMTRYRRTG